MEQAEIRRPWLVRLPGELPHEHMQRLYHSCYHCGRYEEDRMALCRHELTHEGEQS